VIPRLALSLVLLTAATPCAAQFTAAVTPPRRERPTPVAAADTVPRAQLDTVRPTVLSDLKAWVDSAATAMSVPPAAGAAPAARDSTPPPAEPRSPRDRRTPARPDAPRPTTPRPDSTGQRPPDGAGPAWRAAPG
jgi:hypothetical protein